MTSRKIFHIEKHHRSLLDKAGTGSSLMAGLRPQLSFQAGSTSDTFEQDSAVLQKILQQVEQIKGMIAPPEAISATMMENLRKELGEVRKLETEMSEIQQAIRKTKQEIAALHTHDMKGKEVRRITDELDAVVGGTEEATETILSSAEIIDEKAGSLCAKLTGDDGGMASDIQEAVVNIFEACNFQDITGQRITKVVNTMRFIEERINRMMDIWGGLDGLSDVMDELEPVSEEKALLNGPALDKDTDVASQDDIDALFD
jgi:chemotaxis protein CheZ